MPPVLSPTPQAPAWLAVMALSALASGATTRVGAQLPAVAYVIPQQQPDQTALMILLQTLTEHRVEIRRALSPFVSGRVRYSAGAYIVLEHQPGGSEAAQVLEAPAPGGAATRRGVDAVDAHTTVGDTTPVGLPELLGVGVAVVRDSFPIPVTPPQVPAAPRYPTPPGLGDTVLRVVGLYVPAGAGRPLAWTRTTLEHYGVHYDPVDGRAFGDGDALRQRFDVVLLTDAGASSYSALGPPAAAGLRAFVDDGGTVVAIGAATRWLTDVLRLPGQYDDIRPTGPAGMTNGGRADSALVRVRIDRRSAIAGDMVAHAYAWVANGPVTVFVPDTTHARVVATYDVSAVAAGSPVVARAYDGLAAVIDIPQGRGRVVLFAFDPVYRGVGLATLPLLWGSLRARGQ